MQLLHLYLHMLPYSLIWIWQISHCKGQQWGHWRSSSLRSHIVAIRVLAYEGKIHAMTQCGTRRKMRDPTPKAIIYVEESPRCAIYKKKSSRSSKQNYFQQIPPVYISSTSYVTSKIFSYRYFFSAIFTKKNSQKSIILPLKIKRFNIFITQLIKSPDVNNLTGFP